MSDEDECTTPLADQCIWCKKLDIGLLPKKPYCQECFEDMARECCRCHRPYPCLDSFKYDEKRCNPCFKKLMVERAKQRKHAAANNRRKLSTPGKMPADVAKAKKKLAAAKKKSRGDSISSLEEEYVQTSSEAEEEREETSEVEEQVKTVKIVKKAPTTKKRPAGGQEPLAPQDVEEEAGEGGEDAADGDNPPRSKKPKVAATKKVSGVGQEPPRQQTIEEVLNRPGAKKEQQRGKRTTTKSLPSAAVTEDATVNDAEALINVVRLIQQVAKKRTPAKGANKQADVEFNIKFNVRT